MAPTPVAGPTCAVDPNPDPPGPGPNPGPGPGPAPSNGVCEYLSVQTVALLATVSATSGEGQVVRVRAKLVSTAKKQTLGPLRIVLVLPENAKYEAGRAFAPKVPLGAPQVSPSDQEVTWPISALAPHQSVVVKALVRLGSTTGRRALGSGAAAKEGWNNAPFYSVVYALHPNGTVLCSATSSTAWAGL